jgi:hypothetical protein
LICNLQRARIGFGFLHEEILTMGTPARLRMAAWRARQLRNAEMLRQITAQVAKLVGNRKHSAQDAPIVKRLEKTLREVSI